MQARREIGRFADHRSLLRLTFANDFADHNDARRDTDSDRDLDAIAAPHRLVDRGHGLDNTERGLHCRLGIAFGRLRVTEVN